jgi:DNA topoisomerase-3
MISKKGRPFSTFLTCKPGEKRLLGWEFPPREPRAKAPPKKKSARDKFGKKTAESPE